MASTEWQRDSIEAAWRQSFLSELPASATEELLSTAHEQEIVAGQNVYRELAEPRFAFVGLLISGKLRIYMTSPGGRRIAIRYVKPAGVVGITAMLRGGAAAGAEVVTGGALLRIDPITFRRLAMTDAAVSFAIAKELANEIAGVNSLRLQNVFGSVRVRVAWHLHELAVERDGRTVVRVTQQQLADSVGSVREVVARVLAQMREEGVLVRDSQAIIVQDREKLESIATTVDG